MSTGKIYGWFSKTQNEYTGHHEYLTPNGTKVLVTHVSESDIDSGIKYEGAECVGEVVKWIRSFGPQGREIAK